MTPSTTALITGATDGIGRATAFALGRAGYRVGVCSRTASKVDALVEELRGAGIEAAGRAGDVSQPGEVTTIVDHVSAALGEIGVLVNNAGVLIARPIAELTLEDWDATMATNLRSLFLMTRAVLPPMRAKGRGDIVNLASLAARNGFVGGAAYTASKHAVLGFGRSLMLELRKEGIRVITICPGSVDTGMLRDQPMLKSDPARILRPEDVAESVLHTLRLPLRALVSEVDLRPANP
jgi:3-oxoacyl-[acyl-carrier protein] reductase